MPLPIKNKVLAFRKKSKISSAKLSVNPQANSCLFDLILYVPSTIFQLNRDGSSWVEPELSLDNCVLLKVCNHNAVTWVRLKSVAPRSLPLSHCASYL